MIDYRDDMALGKEIIARIAEAYRKIRNTARYLLANLNDFDPAKMLPLDKLADVDRWVLDRAARTFERCRQAYEDYEFHLVYHRVVELCTVDISAVYVDVSKDTMYCDSPDSEARRSAQTAMYMILRGLVSTIAPIMSFTAEEIYEAMPGEKEASVHLTEFPDMKDAILSDADAAAWDRVFRVREAATKVLERARAAKQIGQSLEADIVLHTALAPETLLGDLKIDLAKLFIVSHVDFKAPSAGVAESVEIEGLGSVGVSMTAARGKKCGRCWQYREEVTEEGRACERCETVMDGLLPPDVATA